MCSLLGALLGVVDVAYAASAFVSGIEAGIIVAVVDQLQELRWEG